jgi:predicted phosphodiesterase
VKIHVLSDLHLEFQPFVPPATEADVVVLAGDIHPGLDGLTWARKSFPDQEIVYVAGNHEYYHHTWRGLPGELQAAAADIGIHYLEDTDVWIDGVRFLGATLWTDFRLFGMDRTADAEYACRHGKNDYRKIRVASKDTQGYEVKNAWRSRHLSTTMVATRHVCSRLFLEEKLAEPFEGETVVVTHHLPSIRSLPQDEQGELISASYASNLEPLMGIPALWVHGHCHTSADYQLNGTRVLCNPRGYPISEGQHQNVAFEPGRVVEV